jgi:predicted TIM-barrel fold metal-dependent hydrolase
MSEGAQKRSSLLPDPEPREVINLLISVDDHVIEPAHMFEGRMPQALEDIAPKVFYREDGVAGWLIEDQTQPNMGLNAVAGRPADERLNEPTGWDQMRPGCYEIEARIADMDINGVYASVCFPSALAGFGGVRFSELKNKDLGLACTKAWNDWHHEEWAAPYPNRIIPLQVPWLPDPAVAAEEIRRNAARGFKTVTFVDAPENMGYPHVMTGHWDPFFAACEETQTVISCHIGASAGNRGRGGNDAYLQMMMALTPEQRLGMTAIATASTCMTGWSCAVNWMWGGVFTRFPKLMVALSESGAGWVPALIDRVDYMVDHAAKAFTKGWPDPELRPSEILLRNFAFCAFDDHTAIELRHRIGIENIYLEVDYPHGDGTWPDSQAWVEKLLAALPKTEIDQLTHLNASRLFRHPLPPEYPELVWPPAVK